MLQAINDNTYKLTVFSEVVGRCFSVDILLNEDMLNVDNILHRMDKMLKTFPTLKIFEDMIKLYCNSFCESMKELFALKEEIKLQFRENSKRRLKANEENIFKAINEFSNYKLQIDSIDSFIKQMSLYKDILMNLEDDKIGKQLKESFCNFSSVMSNKFRNYYQNIKETSTAHQVKEEYLIQTIKELKDEILKHNSKEDNFIKTIKELKDEILKLNVKCSSNVFSLGELNKCCNENYKTFNQTINNLNTEEIKTIRMCLEESKQHNITKLVIETQNLTFSNKLILDNQNSINENLLNKIEENKSFLEEKLKTIKTSVVIRQYNRGMISMISLPNGYIATASDHKTVKIWDLNKSILIKTLAGHIDQIRCLALLSDGNIASGSDDKTIKFWESQNDYKCINTLSGHT
jgi:WD40 repeat protein